MNSKCHLKMSENVNHSSSSPDRTARHWSRLFDLCCICGDHNVVSRRTMLCDSQVCQQMYDDEPVDTGVDTVGVTPVEVTEEVEVFEMEIEQAQTPPRRYPLRTRRVRFDPYPGSFFNPIDVSSAGDDHPVGSAENPMIID